MTPAFYNIPGLMNIPNYEYFTQGMRMATAEQLDRAIELMKKVQNKAKELKEWINI